jgi:hypothetical protein
MARFAQGMATVLLLLPGIVTAAFAEDQTYLYTVQITASVQVSPPSITLNWQPDPYGANSFTVYRKSKTATSWGNGTVLSGAATGYTDFNVQAGAAYEYQIVKQATLGYVGYGYIFIGINAPLIENRGKLILINEASTSVPLDYELTRLRSDLAGDGWQVISHSVSSNDTPASVKSLIVSDYHADPANVQAVFLFGHVPIFYSGNLDYDGHMARPMPADAYYGDMDGDWSSSPDYMPSDIELMVGRVDLANMPSASASEIELLRNYLNKDHAYRQKLMSVPRRALMGNLRGDESGEATAASGYRNFSPFVGTDNVFEANVDYFAPPDQKWISYAATGSYLWGYGCGAGQPTGVSGLGTNDQSMMYTTDVLVNDAKVVFTMLFGSWFGNWDDPDDLLRSFLATQTMGLTACMAGRPHWFAHHMGLGETIGYTTRLTMNNSTLYQNQSNRFPRAIYISLMGDPTLRLDVVSPVSALTARVSGSTVNLGWKASTDSVAGYHVYRGSSSQGPFTRLTTSLTTGTNFVDTISSGNWIYMVRAVKLESHFSGSYYNSSQGTFAAVTMNGSLPPSPTITATVQGSALVLSWNSQSGVSYRVQAASAPGAGWSDASGTIIATGASTTWTDSSFRSRPSWVYRVASP